MKIIYLKNRQIDKDKWDNCIKNSQNGLIYGYSWYLDIVCPKWEALITDDYEYVMPLPRAKKKLLNYLYQPLFFQKISIFSKIIISKTISTKFLNSIPKKYKIIDIGLDINFDDKIDSFSIKKRTNYELDLNNEYSVLYKNYSKKHKKNLRKTNQGNYKFIKSNDIIEFIKIKKTDIKFNIVKNKSQYISKLEKIFTYSLENKIGELFFAISSKNKYQAAIFVVKIQKHILKFTARTPEGRKNSLGFFIHDKIIEYYSNQNNYLDFIGSDLEGVARFNKGFGSKKTNYLQISKNNLPFFLKFLKS